MAKAPTPDFPSARALLKERDYVTFWVSRWTGTSIEARFDELGISTEGLRAETAERTEASRVASWRLFDDFGRRSGLLRREAGAA